MHSIPIPFHFHIPTRRITISRSPIKSKNSLPQISMMKKRYLVFPSLHKESPPLITLLCCMEISWTIQAWYWRTFPVICLIHVIWNMIQSLLPFWNYGNTRNLTAPLSFYWIVISEALSSQTTRFIREVLCTAARSNISVLIQMDRSVIAKTAAVWKLTVPPTLWNRLPVWI